MLTATQKYNQGHNYSNVNNKDLKAPWKKLCMYAYPPTLPVFPGVSKFFIKSHGPLAKAPNLQRKNLPWPFSKFFHLFCYVRDVKKETKTRSGFSALNI